MLFSPLLPVHISAGVVGILSGTAAMSFRKGSPRHALAGKIFVIAMVTMSSSAVYLAFMKHQMGNVLAALRVLSGDNGMADRQARDRETSLFDWGMLLIPCWSELVSGSLVYNWCMATQGQPMSSVGMHFFMGSVMLLQAAGGYSHARARRVSEQSASCAISGACALAFSWPRDPSFGTAAVFPAWLRGSPALFVPALAAARVLIFWLFRVCTHPLTEKASVAHSEAS